MRSRRCGPLTWLAVLYSFLFRCGYGRLQRRPESCARGGLGLTRARMLQYHIQSATMCHLNSELVTRWWPGNPTGWKLGRFFCLEREWWVCWPHFNKWTRGLNEMRWPNEMGKGREGDREGGRNWERKEGREGSLGKIRPPEGTGGMKVLFVDGFFPPPRTSKRWGTHKMDRQRPLPHWNFSNNSTFQWL